MNVLGEYVIVSNKIRDVKLLRKANKATIGKKSAIALLKKKAKDLGIKHFKIVYSENDAWANKEGVNFIICLPKRDAFTKPNRYRLGLLFHELAHIIQLKKYPADIESHGKEFIDILETLLDGNKKYIYRIYKLNKKWR